MVLAGLAELGGRSEEAQRLAGAAFGAGTIATLGLLGRRLAGERAWLLAAGLAAVYPVLIAADGALTRGCGPRSSRFSPSPSC